MMIITNLADVSEEMDTLGHLLQVMKEHIFNASNRDAMNEAHALLTVFDDRFEQLSRHIALAVAAEGSASA